MADQQRVEAGRGKMLPELGLAREEIHCEKCNKKYWAQCTVPERTGTGPALLRRLSQFGTRGKSKTASLKNFRLAVLLTRYSTCTRYVWMIRGVMKKINSWFEVLTCPRLNRLPRYGMFPAMAPA